jgi:ATP-dependent Clp protease ATP-binding subunit ClpA
MKYSRQVKQTILIVDFVEIVFFLLCLSLVIPSQAIPSAKVNEKQDRIFWQKNSGSEMVKILTPDMNPLELLIFEGILEATQKELKEPVGSVRIPFNERISSIALPYEKNHSIFQKFHQTYSLIESRSSNEMLTYSNYIIRSSTSSILIIRFLYEGLSYDFLTEVKTTQPIEAIRLSVLRSNPKEFGLHIRLDSSDPEVKGIYELNLRKNQTLSQKKLLSTKSALVLLKESRMKTDQIAQEVKNHIFGQDPVIDRLVHHIFETKTNGMTKPKVIVAMGPSGVGKSYSAQLLAERVYQDTKYTFEISGNEYNAGTHSLDYMKLFGGAKGTGGGEDGSLIRWLKATSGKGVLIINEGDKMHSDIWKRFMEFLEKGRLSDPSGKEVWGKEVIVIITSNRGANRLFPSSVDTWSQSQIDERLKTVTQSELKSYYLQVDGLQDRAVLPREILNRVDDFIAFGPLSKESALKIAMKETRDLLRQFQNRYHVEFILDPKLIEHIALVEFNLSDDARQIRNEVKSFISEMTRKSLEFFPLEEMEKVRVSLGQNQNSMIAKIEHQGKVLEYQVKNLPNTNPLQNPIQRNLLLGLEKELKSQIFGQETNLHQIAQALIAYEVLPNKERPFTLGLFGPSGTGKTEIGKVIAKTFYGESSKATVLPMGNISNPSDFETLFGSPSKYQGGDIERDFEKALRENPKGGVIIMDEVSNMGGSDPKMKEALFKKLYDFFEEGQYRSPRDNRVYKLNQYKFILTGNDGEKLFLTMTADDLLLSTWKQHNNPEEMRRILRESYIPNAFINRINSILLMKPLLKNEVRLVAEKLLHAQVKALVQVNPGLSVTLSENFLDKLTQAFYSPDQGGRSVRKAFDSGITGAIGITLLRSGLNTEKLSGVKLHLDIQDNQTHKPYLLSHQPDREVLLVAEVYKRNKLIYEEKTNLTDIAEKQVLLSGYHAKSVAFHEAGHAVVNDPLVTQEKVSYITIRGGRDGSLIFYGYARYEPINSESGSLDHQKIVARIARLWAGRKAQELAGFKPDIGWFNDLGKIRYLASSYLTTWGLDKEFIGLPLDSEGKPKIPGPLSDKFLEKMNLLLVEGENLAEQKLIERWAFVRSLTAELLWKGHVTEERFNEIDANMKKQFRNSEDQTFIEKEILRKQTVPVVLCSQIYQ